MSGENSGGYAEAFRRAEEITARFGYFLALAKVTPPRRAVGCKGEALPQEKDIAER